MGTFIDLTAADGSSFPAYVAEPAGAPKGAIVVLQEIFGVNSHIQSVADGYASEGYLAVAPATFNRVEKNVDLGYNESTMAEGMRLKTAVDALPTPGVMQDIQAAITYAARGGKVGIVGFCWGGLLVWRSAAALNGLTAAVSYYGGGMTTDEEAARKPKVPMLSHFGEKDHFIPLESTKTFAQKHPEVEVHTYAADHGFNCDQRGSWDAPSAKLARERTLAFFAKHLRG
jgi:carboxymethylenebutenolidase